MSDQTVRISVTLPAAVAAGLTRAAANAGCPRHLLIERVFSRYLMGDAPELSLVELPATLDALPLDVQRETWVRYQLVTVWRAVVEEARGRGASTDNATDDLIARVAMYQGIKLSRNTLYRWSRLLAIGGVVALADRRRFKGGAKAG